MKKLTTILLAAGTGVLVGSSNKLGENIFDWTSSKLVNKLEYFSKDENKESENRNYVSTKNYTLPAITNETVFNAEISRENYNSQTKRWEEEKVELEGNTNTKLQEKYLPRQKTKTKRKDYMCIIPFLPILIGFGFMGYYYYKSKESGY